MKIIICGAGQVGRGIAERLSIENHQLTVIDSSPQLIQSITDVIDVQGVTGYASYPKTLQDAGAEDAEIIIAVTQVDEVNMIACQIAHSLFNVPKKIARIRAQNYLEPQWQNLFSMDHMPIDEKISPEIAVGNVITRRLDLPGAFESVPFADEQVMVLGIECEERCSIVDTPLKQLSGLFPDLLATIVGIVREGRLFAPHIEDQLLIGDQIYAIVAREQTNRLLEIFGNEGTPARRILIAGGGNIGLYVARQLEEIHAQAHVKIIETNHQRALYLADNLSSAMVLNGSVLDMEILKEGEAQQCDTFIALTNDDKVNILSAVMAKRLGAARSISLVSESVYGNILGEVGIDSYVNPRHATISSILQHVRLGCIRGVHPVYDGSAEILDAEVLETSAVIGRALRDLDLPDGIRIGLILREESAIRPTGETHLKPHDRVILLTMTDRLRDIENLFRVSSAYF